MNIMNDYFDFLACVAKADNVVRPKETVLFFEMLKNMGMSSAIQNKYKKILNSDKPIDSDAIISKVAKNTNSLMLPWFIRDAFLMADADGKISKEEIQVIKELVIKSGITQNKFVKIKNWGLEYIKHTQEGLKLFNISK
jgi:tellurite resistance protein